jgi:hypothetical protein
VSVRRPTKLTAVTVALVLALAGVAVLLFPAGPTQRGSHGLKDSRDLIYGSEIGAWEPDGSPAVDPATGIPDTVRGAAVPIIRFAAYDCFVGTTCGSDHHPGTLSRADFDHAIRGITRTMGAWLWLKMAPIAADTLAAGVNGTVFCPPWAGDASGNLSFYRSVVDEVKAAGYLGPIVIESSNEMEYSCWQTWQAQGAPITSAGSPGVSRRLGEHFAATMPALKAYTRSLGFSEVLTGGYIGVGGGPGWGQDCAPDPRQPYGYACDYGARWIDEFNVAVHAAYLTSGRNVDVIPDFESIHAYPHSDDFASAPYDFDDRIAYAYYRTWIERSRARLDALWGPGMGGNILFSISEWNAGAANSGGTWSGWTTPGRPGAFYRGWLDMLAGDGRTTGSGTRYWSANVFEVASNSDTGIGRYYNLVRRDGSTPDWFADFRSRSVAFQAGERSQRGTR